MENSLPKTPPTKNPPKPNIILIVIDGLRPRNLSCYGYKRNTSPNIDSLAKKGVLFEKAFSSYNSTNRCFLSILSGRHILKQDLSARRGFSDKELSDFFNSGGTFIQEILKKHNYHTACFKYSHAWQRIGFDHYFKDLPSQATEKSLKNIVRKLTIKTPILFSTLKKIYYFLAPGKTLSKPIWRIESERATNEAIKTIKESEGKPFFLRIDFNDTHLPYNVPDEFANKFKAEKESYRVLERMSALNYNKKFIRFAKGAFQPQTEIEQVVASYDNAIAYNDFLVGKILNSLKEKRLLDDTIIIVTADHGENLDDHDIFFQHFGLYDTSFNIPLIISYPQLPQGKKIKALTQSIDIVPTILDIANIKYSPDLFDGKSLTPLISGRKEKIRDLIFMEESDELRKLGIRNSKYKYLESPSKEEAVSKISNSTHGGVIELYDLEKDPDEIKNIAKENPELLLKMRSLLYNTIKSLKTENEKRRINRAISSITKNI